MFKSVSAWLRCITHLDRNTKLKCKNISLAAIKQWQLTLLLGTRTGRKITYFPWYAYTVTIQAFCSPMSFPFIPPSPWKYPPRISWDPKDLRRSTQEWQLEGTGMEHHQPGQGDMAVPPGGAVSLGTGLEFREEWINRWGVASGGETEC